MTNNKPLPTDPDLRTFRNQAQALAKDEGVALSAVDARNQVAREYGFDDWNALRTEIEPASTFTTRSVVYDAACTPDHEFFKAVGKLDLDRVREFLDQDPSLANADVRGIASIRPHWGWGPPGEDPQEGETARAVHFAAYTHAALLRLLIEYGADVDAYGYEPNNQWTTPLVLACWEGSRETVRILLEAGANPNLPAIHGGSPLHSAIGHWDPCKIETLLRYGAKHDIFSAAVVGDLEEVKRLLKNDGEFLINRRDIYGNRTPLEWAAFRRQEEVGEYLIEQGAEVTPQVLICLGMLDEIKNCIEEDADFVNRRIGAEWSDPPALWAVRSGQLEVLRLLLAAGADPNGLGTWDQMALPLTVDLPVETSLEAAKLLIDAGADVEVARETWRTHLGEFTTKGKLEVADLLVQHGADVNRKNRSGQTPLQALIYPPSWEERYGDPLIGVKFLLTHGADINALSNDDRTALDIAIAQNNHGVAAYLREWGGLSASDLS